jgi:hypothetical protein
MGGTASGTADLHDAFEVARPYSANYVEVYIADIENPAYAPDLRWLRDG